MTQLTVKAGVSDTYPNPSNAVARAGFGNMWDVINENTQAAELDLASAATTNIGGQTSTKLRVTGTTTITSLGTAYRGPIFVRFAGALTLTYNATALLLPRATSIFTSAGDTAIFIPKSTTSGTSDGWLCVSYSSASTTSGGGGATGAGNDLVFAENDTYITTSYTLGQSSQRPCTVTISAPAMVTQSNTYVGGEQVVFMSTGALPTGLGVATTYYVSTAGLDSTSFQVSATRGGASINTSGTQSGTHTSGKAKSAQSVGPISTAAGVIVSIPSGQKWVIS